MYYDYIVLFKVLQFISRAVPIYTLGPDISQQQPGEGLFIDRALSFVLRSAPKLSTVLVNALKYFIKQDGVEHLRYCLDYYNVLR